MKNLLLIIVFLLGGCTCDNLGKKAKIVQGQKEDTLKRNSELIKSEHPEDSETTLKEKSNSDSPPLTPGPPESEKRGIGETERRKTKQFTDSPIHPFTDSVRNNSGGDLEGAGRGAAVDSLSVEIQTFQTEKGWGYDVFVDGKKYIHQEIIPAVPGTVGFDTEENAQKVAGLVSYKIRNNIMPPSVTPEELDSLGIE